VPAESSGASPLFASTPSAAFFKSGGLALGPPSPRYKCRSWLEVPVQDHIRIWFYAQTSRNSFRCSARIGLYGTPHLRKGRFPVRLARNRKFPYRQETSAEKRVGLFGTDERLARGNVRCLGFVSGRQFPARWMSRGIYLQPILYKLLMARWRIRIFERCIAGSGPAGTNSAHWPGSICVARSNPWQRFRFPCNRLRVRSVR